MPKKIEPMSARGIDRGRRHELNRAALVAIVDERIDAAGLATQAQLDALAQQTQTDLTALRTDLDALMAEVGDIEEFDPTAILAKITAIETLLEGKATATQLANVRTELLGLIEDIDVFLELFVIFADALGDRLDIIEAALDPVRFDILALRNDVTVIQSAIGNFLVDADLNPLRSRLDALEAGSAGRLFSVPTTAWGPCERPDYNFQAAFPFASATPAHNSLVFFEVTAGVADDEQRIASSFGVSTVSFARDGEVVIFAVSQPTTAISGRCVLV